VQTIPISRVRAIGEKAIPLGSGQARPPARIEARTAQPLFEPVPASGSMAAGVKPVHFRRWQRQPTKRVLLAAERGARHFSKKKLAGRCSIRRWARRERIDPRGASEVSCAAGRSERVSDEARAGRGERRFGSRPSLPSDGALWPIGAESGRSCCATPRIDENIDPAARRDHHCAVPGLERRGRRPGGP